MVSVVVTTGAELALIPYFQTHFANGGVGIMVAMAGGELVMVVAAVVLMRDIVGAAMALDFLRCLIAGGATIALMRILPPVGPLAGIPLCVVTFGACALAVGLVTRSDLMTLGALSRRPEVTPSPKG
jgi:hypothetical protein